jgi:hypothetical protein
MATRTRPSPRGSGIKASSAGKIAKQLNRGGSLFLGQVLLTDGKRLLVQPS